MGLPGVRPGGRRPPAEGRYELQQQKQAAENALAQAQQIASQTQSDYNSWVQQQQQALRRPASNPATHFVQLAVAPPELRWRWRRQLQPAARVWRRSYGGGGRESVLGAPYVFGAAGPSSFDCSGLTMWAWAQAGVSLPHSAAAQYASLPARSALDAVQPGDIIYYGNFGPHVAIYVGGGQIVHARHPGPGGQVQYELHVRLRHAVRRRPARLVLPDLARLRGCKRPEPPQQISSSSSACARATRPPSWSSSTGSPRRCAGSPACSSLPMRSPTRSSRRPGSAFCRASAATRAAPRSARGSSGSS